jgi:PAS domain S-box-containing protein
MADDEKTKDELLSELDKLRRRGDKLSKANSSLVQAKKRLTKLVGGMTKLGPDPTENISLLTALCGELLEASGAQYFQADRSAVRVVASWNISPNSRIRRERSKIEISEEVIRRGGERVLVFSDIRSDDSSADRSENPPGALQTCVGKAVKVGGKPSGALCLYYDSDFLPSEQDQQILTILSNVIRMAVKRREEPMRMNDVRDADSAHGKDQTVELLKEIEELRREIAVLRGSDTETLEPGIVSEEVLEKRVQERTEELGRKIRELETHLGALQSEQDHYRRLIESAKDVIWTLDLDLNYTYISPSVTKMLGYSVEEILELGPLDTMTTESRERVMKAFLRELGRRNDMPVDRFISRAEEVQRLHKDGSIIWEEINTTFLRTKDSEIIGILGVSRDITERKHAESSILESEALFKTVFSCMPEPAVVFRSTEEKPELTAVQANESAERMFSSSKEEITGATLRELVGSFMVGITEAVQRVHSTGKPETVPANEQGGSGAASYDVHICRLHAEDVLTVFSDATERVRFENASYESQNFLQSLLDSLSARIAILDAVGNIEYVNSSWQHFSETDTRALRDIDIGENYFRSCKTAAQQGNEEASAVAKGFSELENRSLDEHRTEYEATGPDGKRWFALTMERFEISGNHKLVIIIDDITARKNLEIELRKRTETIEALVNATGDMAFLLDIHGSFLSVNEAVAQIMGKPRDELVGTSAFEIVPTELARTIKSGVDIVTKNGQSARFETRREDMVYHTTIYPVLDHEGKVDGVAGFVKDITNRVRGEEALVRNERLKNLADVALGVAHHFNNLHQIVMGSAQVALTNAEMGNFSQVQSNLQRVVESSKFGSDAVRRLQGLAKIPLEESVGQEETFDLSNIVYQAVEVSRVWWESVPEKLGTEIELTTDLDLQCLVKGYPSAMFEVMLHLIKNAVEALPEGGRITIATSVQADHVVLEVTDTGSGIPPESLGRVFESHFSTKGHECTGMGLAVCKETLTRHHGTITVNSEPGKGTIFTLRMPQSEDPFEPLTTQTAILGRRLRVLVVDDLQPVATMISNGLATYGQKVITAGSGSEALDLFRENRIDVVVCDLGMPAMNGTAVASGIREICETQKKQRPYFLLLTGWDGQVPEKDELTAAGIDAVLEKPVDIPKILEVVRELIVGREERAPNDG